MDRPVTPKGVAFVSADESWQRQAIGLLADPAARQRLVPWQYRGAAVDAVLPVAAIDEYQQLIGFNGVIPVRVKLGERCIVAAWSCDFVVHPKWRGRGVGASLKRKLQTRVPVLLALGISQQAAKVHSSLGWHAGRGPVQMSYVVKSGSYKEFIKRTLQVMQRMLRWRARVPEHDVVVSEQPLLSVLGEIDALWERVEQTYKNVVVRDSAYLRWRYVDHPLMIYSTIAVRRDGRLEGVGIYWVRPGERCVLADYVGAADDRSVMRAIVDRILTVGQQSLQINCFTNSPGFLQVLRDFGFSSWRTRPVGFSVFSSESALPVVDDAWFLMGGDSDGDLLDAARHGSDLSVELWDEPNFLASRAEWQDLLARSDADPLFLGWEWQSCWWRNFAHPAGLQGHWLAARDRSGRLVGVAPLFKDRMVYRGINSRRLQFVGNVWRGPSTMRSEYLEFILDRERASEVADALIDQIAADSDWDEFILSDLDEASVTAMRLIEHPTARRWVTRRLNRYIGYAVPLEAGADAYKASLPASVRRRLFNLRRRLEALGSVEVEYALHDQFDEYAHQLDVLHTHRWGEPFFVGRKGSFHRDLVNRLNGNAGLQLSLLKVGGRAVSALYNLRIGCREYNIQGGFNADACPGLPIALLHMGYVIERAAVEGVRSLELLIGGGKHRDFKREFAAPSRQVSAFQLLRSRRLRVLYSCYDHLLNRD